MPQASSPLAAPRLSLEPSDVILECSGFISLYERSGPAAPIRFRCSEFSLQAASIRSSKVKLELYTPEAAATGSGLAQVRFFCAVGTVAFRPPFCFGGAFCVAPSLAPLSATAARMSCFSAVSLRASPSRMSIALVALASRPALKRRSGSSSEAPLKKLILQWSWKAPAAMTLPFFDQVGRCGENQAAEAGEHDAPPIAKVLDVSGDLFRWIHKLFHAN